MNEGVGCRAVPGVLEPHLRFQSVEQRLDDETLSQQQLVEQRHEIILHVAADTGDQAAGLRLRLYMM